MPISRTRLSLLLALTALVGLGVAASTCSDAHRSFIQPAMTIHSLPWHHQRHHVEDGFQNIYGEAREESFFKTMSWVIGHAFQRKENIPPPVRPADLSALAEPPSTLRITWVGHATALIQTPSLTVLTDPMFSDRASPVSFAGPEREVPVPLSIDDLPPIDVVVISHDHYDHLDETSIQQLTQRQQPLFLVPLGVGGVVQGWGAERVAELDWWQYVDLDGWRIHCTPARHFSGRSLTNRTSTLWASWYLAALDDTLDVYYAGDTGYADHFSVIRERLGAPDVALIPIGAYEPRWFMEVVHVDPEQAVQAFLDLQARHMVPVHWGTFDLADEPIQEPPERLRAAATDAGIPDQVHVLDVGETVTLEPHQRASPTLSRRTTERP